MKCNESTNFFKKKAFKHFGLYITSWQLCGHKQKIKIKSDASQLYSHGKKRNENLKTSIKKKLYYDVTIKLKNKNEKQIKDK